MGAICPICKGDCNNYYFDAAGDICGCENCITVVDAGEYEAERAEQEADFYKELCSFGMDR